MPLNWVNSMKIAILERNYEKIDSLARSMPNFTTLQELLCAKDLILESIELLVWEQKELQKSMGELKKAKKYFETAGNNKASGYTA